MRETADPTTTLSGWRDHYRRRNVRPEVAVAAIQPGDNVYAAAGHNVEILVAAMLGRGIPLTYHGVGQDLTWLTEELAETIHANVLFGSPVSRAAVNDFLADFTPWWIYAGHKAAAEGRPGARSTDVSLIRVTPPNRAGWCCLGSSIWDALYVTRRARTTIAVVGTNVLHTYGDTWIPVTDIDWFVEDEPALAVGPERWAQRRAALRAHAEAPLTQALAGHVSSIVRDGDTVQVGLGLATSGIVQAGVFAGKNDLGCFAELTVPGMVQLVEDGVINGRYLRFHPGKFLTTAAGGLPEENELIDENPAFEFYGTEYMHDPAVIARNDNMLTINCALSVDLTGQIAAGQFGTKVWSGTGGQLAYQLGAQMSRGGRAVTVLPATAQGGQTSRIVAEMPAGQIITVPRDLADLVVTEFGVAELLNRTQRERARALIEIAHPDFRADLIDQAKRLYGA